MHLPELFISLIGLRLWVYLASSCILLELEAIIFLVYRGMLLEARKLYTVRVEQKANVYPSPRHDLFVCSYRFDPYS